MTNTADNTPVAQAKQLTKDFGNGKGVFGVDFVLHPGEVIGFVGPNGAGKSTTINILTGLVKPDSGQIELFGKTYDHNSLYKVMSRVGVMYSESTLDETLTAQDVFTRSQELLGKDYSHQWTDMSLKLELDLHKKIRKLSFGNKKKVGVIHALMHEPDIIIMDEPTSGLDPIIRERFIALIRQAAARGAGVLLSSHDLGEVQEVSDRIVMIKQGQVVMTDRTDTILNKAQRLFRLIKPPQKLIAKIEKAPFVSRAQHSVHDLSFYTSEYEAATELIATEKFYNFFIERSSLEDTFKEYYD